MQELKKKMVDAEEEVHRKDQELVEQKEKYEAALKENLANAQIDFDQQKAEYEQKILQLELDKKQYMNEINNQQKALESSCSKLVDEHDVVAKKIKES